MRMLEAFKRLLDGEKITRGDWKDTYIQYDKEQNMFIHHPKNSRTGIACTVEFRGSNENSFIAFEFEDYMGTKYRVCLSNRDEIEIYVSEEEKMEVDAMRWRLSRYCCGRACTEADCKIYKPGISCSVAPWSDLADISSEEVKRLYDLIKEDN